jgi:tetratricopeptide (TPR) repeat protein
MNQIDPPEIQSGSWISPRQSWNRFESLGEPFRFQRLASRGLNWTLWAAFALLAAGLAGCRKESTADADQFTRLSNLGKSQLEAGDAAQAAQSFQQALALKPTLIEARLNLANAFLLGNQAEPAIQQAQQVLQVDPNSAAAHYLAGCAHLRLGRAEEALKALQQSHRLDPAVTALNFQLGLAHERLGHHDEALQQFQTVLEFEPEHAAAHYRLAQLLLRLGRQPEAAEELKKHQEILSKKPGFASDVAMFERCKHTQAKLPFKLEQPLPDGVKVTFADATTAALGSGAAAYRGPVGVIDLAHDGRHSLFVREGDGFRLLLNSNGTFLAQGPALPGIPGATYHTALVGDLQNDRTEDVVLLGDQGSHVFRFTTNGVVTDVTRAAGFTGLSAVDGVLLDFDYTGKLGLIALQPDGKGVRAFRNLSSTFALYFSENNVTSGLPASLPGGRQLVLEDWNHDELMDVTLTREGQPPLVFARERGGPFVGTNLGTTFPAGALLAAGDLNNDSVPDVAVAAPDAVRVLFGGGQQGAVMSLGRFNATAVSLIDYDNDGWLDVCLAGDGLRVWRNRGAAGFRETTQELGFDKVAAGKVQFAAAADFDGDCDTDLVVASDGGLKLLRNDGGNVHHMLKLRLAGNRSNASGLGVRFEVSAGSLRAWRTAKQLPIEIGVGRHAQVDSVAVRWFDGFVNHDEIKVSPCAVLTLDEIEKPTGSCPYLYAWDGQRFRFVTDLLGAAPLGLRVSDTRFVEADPVEYVWVGSQQMFPPRAGHYVLQVTEELREVLYLDEAKLVVVDHPPGTEVHTTGRLRPGKPFPPHQLVTLHRRQPLMRAVNHEGADVTALLADADHQLVSPTQLRVRQLRGLAEPHSVTLDFGPLDTARPLVLALTGWLRFGGGMANVGASHTPDLPFPFPALEVETTSGRWQAVDVVVGAPAGKTKSILVELAGKLPPGSRRLRLGAAFEIHWDRIALFERRDNSETRMTTLAPTRTDLHWRGYSEFEPWPWFLPLTPGYTNVKQTADWTITPAGWCTRYGPVDELIAAQDNALALLNGGDELTLLFAADSLPPKPAGAVRDFFFYSVGWDKDADFHCELGWQVEPLPWHGMDSQLYGRQPRPPFSNDGWMRKYNTRWVGPRTLTSRAR